eukprot:scaffold93559_cov49-Attheya_sp.AAC.2
MQDDDITEGAGNKEGVPKVFSPKVRRNLCGHDKAHVEGKPWVELLLKHDKGVFAQITKVQLASGRNHVWVLLDKEPSHVSKEKTSGGIVRISIRLGVFVVNTMVPRPVKNTALIGDRIAEHQKESHWRCRLV